MARNSANLGNSLPALIAMALGFAIGFVVTRSNVYLGLVGMWFGLAAFHAIRFVGWISVSPNASLPRRNTALWGNTALGNALLAAGAGIFGAVMLWPRDSENSAVWVVAGVGLFLTILGTSRERRGSAPEKG